MPSQRRLRRNHLANETEGVCLTVSAAPYTTPPLSAALAESRRRIDAALDEYSRFASGCPAVLAEAIRYCLLAPGKRLRPTLGVMGGRGLRLPSGSGPAGGVRGGNDPHVFAGARRLAGHGRRRSASRTADMPQGLRRSQGDSRGRCAASPGVRGARPRRAAGRNGRGVRRGAGPSRRSDRAGRRPGRRPGRPSSRRRSRRSGSCRTPTDKIARQFRNRSTSEKPARCFRLRCDWADWSPAPIRCGRRHWRRTAESSAWRFKSSTTCWTSAARKVPWENGWAKIRTAAS